MTSYIFNLSAVFFKNFFINFYYSTVKREVQTRQFSVQRSKKAVSSKIRCLSSKMNPLWVTGFVDGEGCFTVSIFQRKNSKLGWQVEPCFQIGLHVKYKPVLDKICKLLKVGRIYEKGPSAVEFNVISIKELEAVINHFDKYPLNTKKRADYLLWKKNSYSHKTERTFNSRGFTSNCSDQSCYESRFIRQVKISVSWCCACGEVYSKTT